MTAKTGSGGRPWVQLEPKPPKVLDHYAYWADPPPALSERCVYWLRQIERGLRPNRWWLRHGYDSRCELFGVWLWEYFHVLLPVLDAVDRVEPVATVAGARS